MAASNVAESGWALQVEQAAPAAPWLIEDPTGGLLALSAAAVPWRYDSAGGLEFAIVKRRRRSDWAFPKGSPQLAEPVEAAARRELLEETGLTSRHAAALANVVYQSRTGRPKLASYWLVRTGGGEFTPNREVTKLLWLAPKPARVALSYERERAVLDLAVEALGLGLLAG